MNRGGMYGSGNGSACSGISVLAVSHIGGWKPKTRLMREFISMYCNSMGTWRTKSQRTVYQNPWITVREDAIVFPNGKEGIYGVVSMPDTVAVIARRGETICLVRQHRYTVGKDSWELPSGHIQSGEIPLDAAKRELREEAGLTAARWEDLGFTHPALGILNSRRHIFLAEDVQEVATGHEDSEHDMLVRWFSVLEINSMVRENKLFDDYLLAALYKLNIERT
ncbi:MAG: hypothetical protein G01um101438_670 [Parcubacteria group bacterium Gr01-1014_38]|nr:MAG: hypothetical protein G01um101438_670 [Parcubacteria group bacterium Gr01-1014_38]